MLEMPDLSGKQIGRYRVLAVLGSGGMGTVYEAVDPTLGRHIALKILPPLSAADDGRLNRFVQEARAASALNHPHLISIYEIGTSESDGTAVHFIGTPPRPLGEIEADIRAIEKDIVRMLAEVTGSSDV